VAEEAREKGMLIGKVDATAHAKLSESFGVRGYPTLKFRTSPNEEWKAYSGGRKAKDILGFADRMLKDPLTHVTSKADLDEFLESTANVGVGFVIGLGESGSDGDAFEAASSLAKSMQHRYHFAFTSDAAAVGIDRSGNFLASLEAGEAPKFFPGALPTTAGMKEAEFKAAEEWIGSNDTPLVSEIGGHNFAKLGKQEGKLLVMAVVDPKAPETRTFLEGYRAVARSITTAADPEGISGRFVFGHLNGVHWAEFVKQFNVIGDLPRIVVLDKGGERFYEDPEVNEADEIETFLQQVFAGAIPAQREGVKGTLNRYWKRFKALGPSGMLLVLPFLLLILACVLTPGDDSDELETQAQERAVGAAAASAAGDASASADAPKETKKDQ